jgi:hypothetical protein
VRPATARVTLNGIDVTDSLTADGNARAGLVTALRQGTNELRAGGTRTEADGLGQPLVDNQDGQGMRVYRLDAAGARTADLAGWSRDCAATTVVDMPYRSTSAGPRSGGSG